MLETQFDLGGSHQPFQSSCTPPPESRFPRAPPPSVRWSRDCFRNSQSRNGILKFKFIATPNSRKSRWFNHDHRSVIHPLNPVFVGLSRKVKSRKFVYTKTQISLSRALLAHNKSVFFADASCRHNAPPLPVVFWSCVCLRSHAILWKTFYIARWENVDHRVLLRHSITFSLHTFSIWSNALRAQKSWCRNASALQEIDRHLFFSHRYLASYTHWRLISVWFFLNVGHFPGPGGKGISGYYGNIPNLVKI